MPDEPSKPWALGSWLAVAAALQVLFGSVLNTVVAFGADFTDSQLTAVTSTGHATIAVLTALVAWWRGSR